MKIDILDEGYWTPKLFWGYRVMTSVTERGFGGPDKCWGGMGQGEGANQPTKGLSAPLTPSHVTRRVGGVPLGLPTSRLGGQVTLGEIPSALAAAP